MKTPLSGLLFRYLLHLPGQAVFSATGLLLLTASPSHCQESTQPIVYVKHLDPPVIYPPIVRQIRIQGTITLEITIAPQGNVVAVKALSEPAPAHPLLRDDATSLVKRWTFGCSGCRPNENFQTRITFNYRLRSGEQAYNDTTVTMNLPNEVTITASPIECDHCLMIIPDWCKALPRPEYKKLKRIKTRDLWFEVYKVAPRTYAIYEPHQSEETMSYLILGNEKALLLDTGMGISDLRKVVRELTPLPIIVVNSHTHDDHVGDNWQFDTIYSMDTDFSRENAKGSTEDAQAEIAYGEICGNLPQFFNGRDYRTQPWQITKYIHDGETIELGGRSLQILSTPGHTPDALCLFDEANGLLFTGDTYYPAPIWLYRPETDLDAYANSIRRLAALEPRVKVVLGQHNIPVAPPSVLPALVSAFDKLHAGNAACEAAGAGKKLCKVDGFQFLLKAAPEELH